MPSRTPRHALLALLALGLLAPAAAADERPAAMPYAEGSLQLKADYRRTPHQTVRITNHALRPRRVELAKGERLYFSSDARALSTVVFEREVAGTMVCRQLVNFHLADDEFRSAPMGPGDVASFCELEPGRYKYTVVRPHGLYHDSGAKRLEGEVVVHGDATRPSGIARR